MKNKASTLLKQAFSAIVTMLKAKSMALKNKANSMKTRLLIFRLLRNKNVLMSAISHKIRALMGEENKKSAHNAEGNSNAVVLHNEAKNDETLALTYRESAEPEEDDEYPDLRHSLFELEEEDDEFGDGTSSVIDLVKNSREDGKEFKLEDEIDLVADVFIRRFHRQMKMQKLESFKRYKEMLERSV